MSVFRDSWMDLFVCVAPIRRLDVGDLGVEYYYSSCND